MAFNPRTDVVMEVLNAADPSRASLAAQRLSALADSNAAGADFSADLERASNSHRRDPARQRGGRPLAPRQYAGRAGHAR